VAAGAWREPVHRDGLALVAGTAATGVLGLVFRVVAAHLYLYCCICTARVSRSPRVAAPPQGPMPQGPIPGRAAGGGPWARRRCRATYVG
jgi:hypothetical protein